MRKIYKYPYHQSPGGLPLILVSFTSGNHLLNVYEDILLMTFSLSFLLILVHLLKGNLITSFSTISFSILLFFYLMLSFLLFLDLFPLYLLIRFIKLWIIVLHMKSDTPLSYFGT